VTWSSGLLSAFMDNVPAVATFIPIVHDVGQAGVAVQPLWWGLLFGGTANVVALGILERQEGVHISFMEWFRPGLIVAIPTLVLATLLLWLQIAWMG